MKRPASLLSAAAMVLLAALCSAQQSPGTVILEGDLPPSEAATSTRAFHYLPFDVPSGVTRMTIRIEIDDKAGGGAGDTVDHGLIAPGGLDFGKAHWRGWQGGARKPIVISGDRASTSPWYLAGPIPAGRWNLVQSFLRSNAYGFHYRYTIQLDKLQSEKPQRLEKPQEIQASDPPHPAAPRSTALPGWYAGNFHLHSIHSDGANTLEELAEKNARAGIDLVVLTDHNNPVGHADFAVVQSRAPRPLWIAGMEWTSPSGHANAIGIRPGAWLDFRADPGDGRLPQIIDAVHRQGGFFVVNHPFATCTTCTWKYPPYEWARADAIEVWNGAWDGADEEAVALWDSLLRQGRRIRASGGTDYHRPGDPLTPVTWTYARSLSAPEIVRGARLGRLVITDTTAGGCPLFTLAGRMPGDTVPVRKTAELAVAVRRRKGQRLFVRSTWGDQTPAEGVLIASDDFTWKLTVTPPGPGFYRIEIRRASAASEPGAMTALTNPIFVGAPSAP